MDGLGQRVSGPRVIELRPQESEHAVTSHGGMPSRGNNRQKRNVFRVREDRVGFRPLIVSHIGRTEELEIDQC